MSTTASVVDLTSFPGVAWANQGDFFKYVLFSPFFFGSEPLFENSLLRRLARYPRSAK